MVGSGSDRQEEQTRLGAKQLSATMLILRDYREYEVMYRGSAFEIAVGEMMTRLAVWLEMWHTFSLVSCDT